MSAYEIAMTVLEYLRVLAWPVVVLVAALILKDDIRNLLTRLGEFKYKDVAISFPSQTPPNKEISEDLKKTKTFAEEKKEVEAKERIITPTPEQLQQQIAALLTQIAALQTAFRFERIYASIFGSQIVILENLKNNLAGLFHVVVVKVYDDFRQNDPVLKNYAFVDYIGYLINAGLIQAVETPTGRRYLITDLGTDFLNYIEKSGYSKKREH